MVSDGDAQGQGSGVRDQGHGERSALDERLGNICSRGTASSHRQRATRRPIVPAGVNRYRKVSPSHLWFTCIIGSGGACVCVAAQCKWAGDANKHHQGERRGEKREFGD